MISGHGSHFVTLHESVKINQATSIALVSKMHNFSSTLGRRKNQPFKCKTFQPTRPLRECYCTELIISLIPGRGGNEQKFLGEGQLFKGKLIGVLEVKEARGDRMCQDALQELKMAIKASGEHKQRVNIQIAVDGLKIRDEKTGVSWSGL